jgi:type II secretory pathway pseudopilin PulG
MKPNYLMSKIGAAIFAVTLLFGIGIASSVPTQAQWQNDRAEQRRRERERIREERRREREARRNGGYNNGGYNNDGTYNNGGYNNGGYNNGVYGRNRGRDADGYGNYGGSYDLRQTALNAGFADGVKEGRKDRSRNERYDYTDESGFQSGTRDYSSRLGDRSIYQRYYREAFSHGYADGYGGY